MQADALNSSRRATPRRRCSSFMMSSLGVRSRSSSIPALMRFLGQSMFCKGPGLLELAMDWSKEKLVSPSPPSGDAECLLESPRNCPTEKLMIASDPMVGDPSMFLDGDAATLLLAVLSEAAAGDDALARGAALARAEHIPSMRTMRSLS
mmetsp:Transcript_102463/g.230087  ORF Transcript_102463/g.230087 Transcript_102463/m.230087 type:complete len:150 (-) Transcript_102463:73-522(-)